MAKIKKANVQETIESFMAVFRVLKSNLDHKNPLLALPVVQMQVLHYVCEHKQVTMKAIADFLCITPPSVTALVNNLADQSLLRRNTDAHDRRTIHLSLTDKGAKILKKAMAEHSRRLGNLLNKLTKQEQQQLVLLLNKMIK